VLPEDLVAHLGGPFAVLVASRDDRLVGTAAPAFGLSVEPESDQITVFVADAMVGPTLSNLEANGRASLLVGMTEAHEGYQLKGEFVSARPSTEAERTLQAAHQRRVIEHFRPMTDGMSEAYYGRFPLHPSTALTIRIREAFDQTPGPNAGRRVWSAD
jgi:hypothetical protein